MNVHVDPDLGVRKRHLPFETVALVLQGRGALGAYQAGVYEALAEADIHPNWIAGKLLSRLQSNVGTGTLALLPTRAAGL